MSKIIRDLQGRGEAVLHLQEMKIEFDRVLQHPIRNRSHYGIDRVSSGVHHYFMLGNSDVAYYTPDLHTLFVHDAPRQWGKEFLDDAIPA